MKQHKHEVLLQGGVSVSCHKEEGEWQATALEFDIIGYGPTKAKALKMLQELFSDYLHDVASILIQGKKVKFFNPSPSEKWEHGFERFNVRLKLSATSEPKPAAPQGLGKLKDFIDSLGDLGVQEINNVRLVASGS
jgi:hypothetical protein